MRRSHRVRPSPAAVIGSLAIAVSLTGTGIAAVSQGVPSGSIGTAQLKANAVTSPKVKNASLAMADFAPRQLVAGAAGPAGPAGPSGPTGPKGDKGDKGEPGRIGTIALRGLVVTVPAGGAPENGNYDSEVGQANCPSGEKALSGSTEWRDQGVADLETWTGYLRPITDAQGAVTGFRARGGNDSGSVLDFVIWILCYRS